MLSAMVDCGLWTLCPIIAALYCIENLVRRESGCLIPLHLMSALNILMLWIKIDVIVVEILNILKSLTFERENAGYCCNRNTTAL